MLLDRACGGGAWFIGGARGLGREGELLYEIFMRTHHAIYAPQTHTRIYQVDTHTHTGKAIMHTRVLSMFIHHHPTAPSMPLDVVPRLDLGERHHAVHPGDDGRVVVEHGGRDVVGLAEREITQLRE